MLNSSWHSFSPHVIMAPNRDDFDESIVLAMNISCDFKEWSLPFSDCVILITYHPWCHLAERWLSELCLPLVWLKALMSLRTSFHIKNRKFLDLTPRNAAVLTLITLVRNLLQEVHRSFISIFFFQKRQISGNSPLPNKCCHKGDTPTWNNCLIPKHHSLL